ncbi:MAG: hypothetical protein ACLFVO_19435 [Chloroflexaceae bacterium]
MKQSTCIRRWNACRESGLVPGMPDPAEAGTPERRHLDETINLHSPELLSGDVR